MSLARRSRAAAQALLELETWLLPLTIRRGARAKGSIERRLPFGTTLFRGAFAGGKRHGTSTWYFVGGAKRREAEYVDGRAHGRTTAWYRDGRKRYVGEYREGRQSGEWFFFRRDGKLDGRRTGVYDDGLRFGAMKGFNDWNA